MKRGYHCWISIDPTDARKKVAQALQYQRRKQRKLGNNSSDGPERECCDVGMVPSPPDLLRQTAMRVPKGCDKYQLQPPFELIQSCALTKNKEQRKFEAVKKSSMYKSSMYKSSIVQAAAIANIATCGKPTYSSPSKSLHRLLAKSRQSAVQSTTGQCSIELKTKIRGRLIPQQQQQHPETDSSHLPLMHDKSGLFSFSDMELPFHNDCFEQDEPFSISATGEEN